MLKVLFVEDDRVLNHLVNIYFRNNYEIDGVLNANDAIIKLKENSYDIIILDINLGEGMNGVELLKYAKEIEKFKSVPIIAATAYALDNDKEYLLSCGFDGYIAKPFTKDQLLDYIKEFHPVS